MSKNQSGDKEFILSAFAHHRKVGRKLGVLCPFHGGAESPSNIMTPGPRPISVPGGILVHPTIWPQYTNVTDRQIVQTRQRYRNVRRTVTCNGRGKKPIACPLVGRSSPYCEDIWGRYCCFTSFFSDCRYVR